MWWRQFVCGCSHCIIAVIGYKIVATCYVRKHHAPVDYVPNRPSSGSCNAQVLGGVPSLVALTEVYWFLFLHNVTTSLTPIQNGGCVWLVAAFVLDYLLRVSLICCL